MDMLSGLRALITGGASGIGLAIARALRGCGAEICLWDHDSMHLANAVLDLGKPIIVHQADVTDREQVQDGLARLALRWPSLDILVNNAGIGRPIPRELDLEVAEERWEQVIAANLTGPFLMAMASLPILTRPGAKIINISSVSAFSGGLRPGVGALAYAASKAGLNGLTFALARELGPDGITVNGVAPGVVAGTGMAQGMDPEVMDRVAAESALGRWGDAREVAAAVCYLASPDAGFTTGTVMHVNGGWRIGG